MHTLAQMTRRSYEQYCGVAVALDILGERWTLLIVRDLLLGPRRYGEIAGQLPAAGTDLITARLKTLVEHGLVGRANTGGPGGGVTYSLTPAGERLRPLIEELAIVGLAWLPAPFEVADQIDLGLALSTLAIHLSPTTTPLGTCRIDEGFRQFELVNDGVDVTVHHETDPRERTADVSLTGRTIELLAVLTGRLTLEQTSVDANGDANTWITAVVDATPAPLRAEAATRTS
jgi:DNA-binding HxlR family transcriptional regulator